MLYFLLLLPFFSLFSAPIGNPSSPALLEEGFFISDQFWSNVQVGITGDYLWQKKLRTCHKAKAPRIHHAQIQGPSEVADLTWNIRERFNLQAHLGAGQCQWKWNQDNGMIHGQSHNGLLWSGSAKLIILEIQDTSLAFDGQAGGWDFMKGHSNLNGTPILGTNKLKLRFWQAGAALTQKIGLFAPYIGCLANQTRFKISHLSTGLAELHSQIVLGPFVGCTISNGSKFLLNIEWRGWFEEGLSLSGQFRF